MEGNDELRRIREAKSIFGKQLLDHPDIHGIGIGYNRKGNKKTKTLALVVHVYNKRPLDEIEESRRIKPRLTFFSHKENNEVTVPVDIREKAPPRPEVNCPDCDTDFEDRVRPVPGGFSIGLDGVPGGTLGGYAWDKDTGQIVLLSNEHVLGSTSGDTIIQPSSSDGGSSPADNLGEVVRSGTLDVTIGRVNDSEDEELEIECIGSAVYEITDATLEMEVEKVGQTTGLTCGIVELIDYDSGHYGSHNDLWIDGDGDDFSLGGDSGSLYVEKNPPEDQDWKRVVGIHWGGSGNDGVGHPIRAVFNDLNLTTLCAGIISALIEAIFGTEEEVEEEEEEPVLASATSQMRCRPGPIVRNGKRAGFYHGIARDFEKRIQDSKLGSQVLKVLRSSRADVVEVLRDGDGRRAIVAALAPILCGNVTTDDILEHTFTASDIERFKKAIQVASRVKPKIKQLLILGEDLLDKAEGKTLHSIIWPNKKAKS